MVPQEITASTCFAFNPEVSGDCQRDYPDSGSAQLVETKRGNFAGLYPPVFYAVTGLFASADITGSAIAIRIFNAALFVALNVALFLMLPVRRRPTLVWGWLITMIPLGMFILPSNNPSSWAILSAGVLWLALVGYFESSGARRIGLASLGVLATVLAGGARADAAVYSVLAAVVAVVIAFNKSRAFFVSAILPIAVIVISGALFLSASQGGSAAGGLASTENGANPLTLLAYNFLNLPLLWAGIFGSFHPFGSFGLGWLDTAMPGLVSIGALVCFVVIVFGGLAYVTWRKNLALAIVALSLVVIPLYVLQRSNAIVGAEVQPRYLLPLVVVLAGIALFRVDELPARFQSLQRYFVAAVLIAAQSVALHYNLRRYLTGLDVGNWNLNADIEWWWVSFVSPMTVWLTGSIAFGLLVVVIVKTFDPKASRLTVETADSARIL